MNVSDLMIGDLVYIHEPECKGHRIDSIDELDGQVGADGEVYDECDIRPIPLTFTMLIENGFEHQMPYNDYALGDKLALHECGEGFAVTGGIGSFNTRLQINYVHELQHLLRLMGIEKEVIL